MNEDELRISEEMRDLIDKIAAGDFDENKAAAEAACATLKGLAQVRVEMSKQGVEETKQEAEKAKCEADTKLTAKDILHETVELIKGLTPLAGVALTWKVWQQSLKIDQLEEMITTQVGKAIANGKRL